MEVVNKKQSIKAIGIRWNDSNNHGICNNTGGC